MKISCFSSCFYYSKIFRAKPADSATFQLLILQGLKCSSTIKIMLSLVNNRVNIQRKSGWCFICRCHQNIWLHFAVASYASLSCPVLLIWPVYRVGSVMRVTPPPHPVWMDRPLSHTSVHTCNGWVGACKAYSCTQTPAYLSPHVCTKLRQGDVVKCPGGNDRFRGCCGWKWTEAALWRMCVTSNMQRWRGVMTSSV